MLVTRNLQPSLWETVLPAEVRRMSPLLESVDRQIIDEIVDHAQQHRDLTDEMAHYQSDHGNPAGDPSILHPHPAIDLTPAKSTTKPRKTTTTSKTTATSKASATPRTASTRRKADGTTNG